MAAKSGLMQMLSMFGIEFDLEEIKVEALKFRQIMLDIDSRLTALQRQQDALATHLGMELHNERHSADQPPDNGAAGPDTGRQPEPAGSVRPALSAPAPASPELQPERGGDLGQRTVHRPAANGH